MKVRIKKVPKKAYGGQQSNGALDVTPAKWGDVGMRSAKEGIEVQKSLTAVPRSKANLEAEGGETAFGPISGDTIPDHYKITGPRHSNGGVPLNLPDDTFIFSDTKAMKITDPKILIMFGKKPRKGGYTPADLAKPYDINKYKAILLDKNTDRKDRETAELMIKNYIMKLGALALAQESKKGFPQGIPEMARPYMEANGITEDQLMPQQEQEGGAGEEPMMKNGGLKEFKGPEDSQVDDTAKTLKDQESYKNATDQQRALFESMNPQQRQMMRGAAGQQQRGQFDNQQRVSGFPGGYNQQQGYYPNQRGGRRGFSDFNPFGQRAFTKDFDYLTPFKGPSFSGTNMPFTGQMPAGNNQLTGFSQNYKKNPLLKSMFSGWINPEKNVARRELTNTWKFNGAGSSTPSLAGGNNAISNFKIPQLDFNQSTQSGFNPQGNQGAAGSLSNRQFARDFQGEGFGSKGQMRRNLRKGNYTQQEYLDLMDQEGSSITSPGQTAASSNQIVPQVDPTEKSLAQQNATAGKRYDAQGVEIPTATSNKNAMPNWLTDPIGSAQLGTEPSRLPIQPKGTLSRPVTKMSQSLQNQDAINRPTTATANNAAFNIGSNLNQMRTDAGMYDTTPTNTPFDFSTDRTQPTNTFGQTPITKSLDAQGTDVYRRSLLKNGVDDGRNNNPNSGNLFGFDEGGIIGYDEDGNPIYAPGTEPEIVDSWFDKGYYGDRSIGQRKAGEEGYETSAGGVDFSSVDYVPKTKTRPKLTYKQTLKKFPAGVFDFNDGEVMPSEEDTAQNNSSGDKVVWGSKKNKQKERTFTNAYKQKNFYPRRDRIYKWYNTLSPQFKGTKEGLDLQVMRDQMVDKLEQEFDKKYGFEDYELDLSSRPAGELTGPYTGQSGTSGSGTGGEGQGFKRAFGGENPILDMFVYGGDEEYPHGGSFHMPTKDYAKDFQSNNNGLGNPMAQTAEDPYVNLHGKSSGVVYNSQTGGLDETNPEYAEGNNPFSVENTQKINSAYTFRPQVAMAQAGALGRVGENIFDGYNAAKNQVSANNLNRMQDSKEGVTEGGDMANEQGIFFNDNDTSNMYSMTKYGGTPIAEDGIIAGQYPMTEAESQAWYNNSEKRAMFDAQTRLVESQERSTNNNPEAEAEYKAIIDNYQPQGPIVPLEDQVNAANEKYPYYDGFYETEFKGGMGNKGWDNWREKAKGYTFSDMYTRDNNPEVGTGLIKRFGGTPMAMYGADMGGAYYPTMENGGSRKVRILPKAPNGLTVTDEITGEPRKMNKEEIIAYRKKHGTKATEVEAIPEGSIDLGGGEWGSGSIKEGSAQNVESDLGKAKSSSSGPNSAWADTICNQLKKGVSVEQLVVDGHGTAKGLTAKFADCIKEVSVNEENAEIYTKAVETPAPDGKKKCTCYEIDEQGNQTTKVVSETIIDPSKGETCDCEATVEAMRGADPKDPGGYSDMELDAIKTDMRYRLPRMQSRRVLGAEFIPTKVSPRVADIKSKGAQNVRAMQTAGMKPNQIVAALMGPGMEQSLAEQGKRYNQADQYNAGVETDASYKNMMTGLDVDKTNAQIDNRDQDANIRLAGKELQGRNAGRAFTLAAKQSAAKGAQEREQLNFMHDDYQVDRNNRLYKRYNPKDPNPTKPKADLMTTYDKWKRLEGMDDPNIAIMAKEEWKANNAAKYGGFIPRYDTMPYGN